MFRKMLVLVLTLLMLLNISASAEFMFFENMIPDEPIETDTDLVRIIAEYLPETDRTTYSVLLKDAAVFPDGTRITAQDLLFTLYTYLDPAYPSAGSLTRMEIPGLLSYRAQISPEHYADAIATMEAISEAGAEHSWSETDGWTQAAHNAYWSLRSAYVAACEAEFPVCAQEIVNACLAWQSPDGQGLFGRTVEELLADPELHVALTMVDWGYAFCVDETTLEAVYSGTVWQIDGGFAPTLNDFVNELKLAYNGDLALCWAVEASGDYEPALPDVENEFVRTLYAGTPDFVASIEGIRLTDEYALEIDLAGVDMRSEYELLGQPVLSAEFFADASLWAPENGVYGHAFGDVAAIAAAVAEDSGAHTAIILEEYEDEFLFG